MHSVDQFLVQINSAIQDSAGKLTDRDSLFPRALQRYSKDEPLVIVTDVTASGTSDQPLPGTAVSTFEKGFSEIRSVEYPVGHVPAAYLLDEDWDMYETPSGQFVRLLSVTPSAGEAIRITWTARHAADGSTVPDKDFEAVCDFAAALGYEALASIYTQTGDSTIQADTVNYRTKNQEYLSLAKAARKRYYDHLGVDGGVQGQEAPSRAAISLGSLHEDLGGVTGVDRMTHPRATR